MLLARSLQSLVLPPSLELGKRQEALWVSPTCPRPLVARETLEAARRDQGRSEALKVEAVLSRLLATGACILPSL